METPIIGGASAMAISWPCLAGKQLPFGRKKQNADFSDDEGTAGWSTSKKAIVSAFALTLQLLISESDPMDAIPTEIAWAVEKMVDTTG
jgi:hypothetical protein